MASSAPSLELALGNELRLLSRLVYKNRNQHQHAKYFRSLIQVHRLLKQLLAEAPLVTLLAPESACPQQDKGQPALVEDHSLRDLESFKKHAGERLSRILRWMQYVHEEVLPRSTHCARQILGLVSQGFFLPLALTLLCALARCRSLLLQLVDLVASQYNTTTESLSDHEARLQQLGLPAAVRVAGDAPDARLESIWSFAEVPASSSGEARLREERPSVGGGLGKGSETEPTEEGRVREESFPGTPSTVQAGRREPEESAAQAVTAPQSDGSLALDSASRREAAAFGVAGTSGLPGSSPADDNPQARSEGSEKNLLGSCQTGALPIGPCLLRQLGGAAEESPAQGQEKGGMPAASAASDQLKRAMLDLGFGDFLGDKRDKKKKRPKSDNK